MTIVLLNRAQVLARLGDKSVSWLYERMAAGEFPRPIKLGGSSSVAWVEAEVNAYLEAQIAEGRVVLTAKPRARKTKAPTTSDPAAAQRSLAPSVTPTEPIAA
jgi:predicted DNA-binding transcriptional regulator AlpA